MRENWWRKYKRYSVFNHVLSWLFILIVYVVVVRLYASRVDWETSLMSLTCCVALFYVNYLVLIPWLLFRHRVVLYVLSSLVVMMLAFVSSRYFYIEYYNHIQTQRIGIEGYRDSRPINTTLGPVQVLGNKGANSDTIKIFPYSRVTMIGNTKDTLSVLTLSDTIRVYPRSAVRIDLHEDTLRIFPDRRHLQLQVKGDTALFYPCREAPFFVDICAVGRRDSVRVVEKTAASRLRILSGQTPESGLCLRGVNSDVVMLSAVPMPAACPRRQWWESHGGRHNIAFHPYNPISRINQPLFFSLLLVFTASIALSFIRKWKREELRRSEIETEKVHAELGYLKQQINPHFLFNTLNAIYSYTLAVSTPASDAVLKLSSILRYMLYETNKDRVPISEEVEVIRDYIELQKLRLTERTTIHFGVHGGVEGYFIEPMLLIPILENAFKFGVDSVQESFVKIDLSIRSGELLFTVVNRIVTRPAGDNESSGIGIKNIRRRLELIYQENYELKTEEREGNFYVSLRLKFTNVPDL